MRFSLPLIRITTELQADAVRAHGNPGQSRYNRSSFVGALWPGSVSSNSGSHCNRAHRQIRFLPANYSSEEAASDFSRVSQSAARRFRVARILLIADPLYESALNKGPSIKSL